MPSFLLPLLILISSFVLGGKPLDIPPQINNEIVRRGTEISELTREANQLSPTPAPQLNQSDQDEENDFNEGQNGQGGETGSETVKVSAYNESSEKEMPVSVPQEAVDNSSALSENPPATPTPTPILTPTPTTNPEVSEVSPRIMIPPPIYSPGCGCGSYPGRGNTPDVCVCNY